MAVNELIAGERDTIAKIESFTQRLSDRLQTMREMTYPPEAQKVFGRTFSTTDLVRLLGVPESTLRTLTLEGKGPQPHRADNNRRIYTVDQVWELRAFLAELRPDDALRLVPHRRPGEFQEAGLERLDYTMARAVPRPQRRSIWRTISHCRDTGCCAWISIRRPR